MRRSFVFAAVVFVAAVGCGAGGAPIGTPAASPLPVAELRYRVFDRVGEPWYCDPDFYPVARQDEATVAEQRFPEIQREKQTYEAILRHNGLAGAAQLTADQRLVVYRDWKKLNALPFEPTTAGHAFTIRVRSKDASKQGELVTGTIDAYGLLRISKREPAGPPNCPICLASTALIDTPLGPVPVSDLRAGMLVWTADASGRRVAAPLIEVGNVEASTGHQIVRLALADGRSVTASPGHPTADGRMLGQLRVGDHLDGSLVVAVDRLPYLGRTYDVLPAGATGLYWADGVLLKSTLRFR